MDVPSPVFRGIGLAIAIEGTLCAALVLVVILLLQVTP